mgnify:CR=1 FL=1
MIEMEYRLGNSKWVHQRGETVELVCPNCHNKVNFGVFSNLERRLAVNPTLLDTQTVYFLVCLECASVYTVEEARGKAFQKGEKLSIVQMFYEMKTPVEAKIYDYFEG